MNSPAELPPLAPGIGSLLRRLRRRIRLYVAAEAVSLAVCWLGAAFWLGLAMDYLPVLAGATEMPRAARAGLLAVVACVLVWIVYRWLLRRVLTPLRSSSLALVLERRYGDFRDSLVTAVELAERPDHAAAFDRRMLEQAHREAAARLPEVRLGEVFRWRPLVWKAAAAAGLAASVAGLYVADAAAVEIWIQRLTLMSDAPWPRRARIEVTAVETRPPAYGLAAAAPPQRRAFRDGVVKVGRGSDVSLFVRADARAPVIPEVCVIEYRTEEGQRGRAPMKRIGRPRDGYQLYRYDGRPLQGALADVRFDVVGYDHRVRDYVIDVVDNPTVTDLVADCRFPEYMVDEQLGLWLPRTAPLDSGVRLPIGTRLRIRAASNKRLKEARVTDPETGRTLPVALGEGEEGARRFSFQPPPLEGDLTLEITLLDEDGVMSPEPHRLRIAAVEDQPPEVDVVLTGVSTAVTPEARLPLQGEVRDDYGLAEAWFELQVDDGEPRRFTFQPDAEGRVDATVDLRDVRRKDERFQVEPGQKLTLSTKATDRYDLSGQPHLGVGDAYQLEVVTPQELLAQLEARELGLRQRLEQIMDEMTQTRDSLARLRASLDGEEGEAGRDPLDRSADPAADAAAGARMAESLRRARVQQALRQTEKSSQETLGVAAGFRDIRDELINNRVDTEERKQRLERQIAQPLQEIAETEFRELQRRLEALEQALDEASADLQEPADQALAQINELLARLDEVLQRMLDLETFNELIGIVRSLMEEQQKVLEATKELRKKEALEFFQLPSGSGEP